MTPGLDDAQFHHAPAATLLARAAYGDRTAVAWLLADWRTVDWARLASLRAILVSPESRRNDAVLTIARMLRNDRSARACAAAFMQVMADAREDDQDGRTAALRAVISAACTHDPSVAAYVLIWRATPSDAHDWSRSVRWDEGADDALVRATIRDARAACRVLAALAPIEGALALEHQRMMADAIHDAMIGADLIAALAPQWTRLDGSVRERLLRIVQAAPAAARRALIALLSAHHALTLDQQRMLIAAIRCDATEMVALAHHLSPSWMRMDATVRRMLLDAAWQNAQVASAWLGALLSRCAPILAAEETGGQGSEGNGCGALTHADWRDLLDSVVRHPDASVDVIESCADSWMRLADDVRAALIAAAAQDAHAAQRALIALLPITGALSPQQIAVLAYTAAHASAGTEQAARVLAAQWGRIDASVRAMALDAAACDAGAAQHILMALLPIEGALPHLQQRALARAVARRPDASARVIRAAASCWLCVDEEVRTMLVRAATRDPDAACGALSALLPVAGALTPDQRWALAAAVARSANVSADCIQHLAPSWSDVDPRIQHALLAAAAPLSATAGRAFAALMGAASSPPGNAALAHDQQWALAASIARNADVSAQCIQRLAPVWQRVDARTQHALLAAVTQRASAARHALHALIGHEGTLTPDWQHALAVASVQTTHHLDSFISRLAPLWMRLDMRARDHMLRAAMGDPWTAYRVLMTLAPIRGALTAAWQRDLASAIAHHPRAGCDAILSSDAGWTSVDVVAQRTLLACTATYAPALRRALAHMLPDDGVLTPMDALDRAAVIMPATAWNDVDAALQHASPATRCAYGVILAHLLAAIAHKPITDDARSAIAAAWRTLTPHDHARIARMGACAEHVALALAQIVDDAALNLHHDAARPLVRTLMPAIDAIAALASTTAPTPCIAAWLPDGPVSDVERAAWQTACLQGLLPWNVSAAVAAGISAPAGAHRRQRRQRWSA